MMVKEIKIKAINLVNNANDILKKADIKEIRDLRWGIIDLVCEIDKLQKDDNHN